MQPMSYIGLDVHKRKISYCVKDSSGKLRSERSIPATRFDLDRWMKTLLQLVPIFGGKRANQAVSRLLVWLMLNAMKTP